LLKVHPNTYPSLFDGIDAIWKAQGFQGLFFGFTPTVTGYMLQVMSSLLSYITEKRRKMDIRLVVAAQATRQVAAFDALSFLHAWIA
jgi:hypothetical protein